MYPVHGRCTFELWHLLFLHLHTDKLPCLVRPVPLSASSSAQPLTTQPLSPTTLADAALALATAALASATFPLAPAALAAPARVQLRRGLWLRHFGDTVSRRLWLRTRLRSSGPQPVPSRHWRLLRNVVVWVLCRVWHVKH